MDVFEFGTRLIQLDTSSNIEEEGVVTECWDITAGTGEGWLFSLVERSRGLSLRAGMTEIPTALLVHVLKIVEPRQGGQ
jgi:hypothetical protein